MLDLWVAELVRLAAARRFHVETETFPLDDIGRAVDALRTAEVHGRAVILP